MIFGKNPYTKLPHWEINGTELNLSKNIKYLGTVVSSISGNPHVEGRITAAQIYSLQGGGLMFNSVNPETAINIYRTAVKIVLMSECSAIQLSKDHCVSLTGPRENLLKPFWE